MADRNFDDLVERFAKRIYGGLKGRIRLAVIDRALDQMLDQLNASEPSLKASESSLKAFEHPLKVLEVGGGLGQHAIRLAGLGHKVCFNEFSAELLDQAKSRAKEAKLIQAMEWHLGPYQTLEVDSASIDLLMCHAVLEWLENPTELFSFASDVLRPGGMLSLSFYNPAAKQYRNLIRGNFDWLRTQQAYRSDSGSLTPNAPCTVQDVEHWAAQHEFNVRERSGIRVFSDYVVERRGGLASEDETLAMELEYSDKEPFLWLGRYLHFTLQKR